MFIFAIPLMDLVAVTMQRLLSGGSPFKADRQHVHPKLLALGFAHQQVVVILYGLQLLLVLMAYASRWSSDGFLMGMYLLVLAGLGTFYYIVSSGRLRQDVIRGWSTGVLYWRTWVDSNQWLSQWCLYGLLVGMMGFFLLGVLSSFSALLQSEWVIFGHFRSQGACRQVSSIVDTPRRAARRRVVGGRGSCC